jgi:hypothetical protein
VRSKQVTPPFSATNALKLVCKSGARGDFSAP